MKFLSFLLIPAIALVLSACATDTSGTVYYGGAYGYGPGPAPVPGYYWNGTVYVQGPSPYYRSYLYNRSVTNVNDVNVNRTVVNDRTVNNTRVNNTNVNDRTLNRTNVNQANVRQANVRALRKHPHPTPAQ